jgi:outer membrane protein assembly factor BamB
VANGKAYIASEVLASDARDELRALDSAKGQRLWTRSFDHISAAPVADKRVLYIHGEERGKWLLYAIDAGSGDLRWKQYGHWPAFSPPVIVDDVVFSARQQELTAYRAANGRRLWNRETTEDMFLTSPAVSSGVVMVGGYWHGLYAYRAKDGSPLWNQDLVGGSNSTPVVANGLVYAGSGGTLFAFKVEDGTPIWRRDTGYYVAPSAVANGVLYVAEATADKPGWHDVVHALRAEDGKQLWRRSFAGGDSSSIFPGLAVANGVVYVGSWTGHLYALDAADGSVLKTLATGGRQLTAPTIANGLVYVGTWESDGQVQAFGLSDAPHP